MPLYLYEIAAGFDNIAGIVNIETVFRTAPRGVRIPLGAVTRTALSGKQRTDGERIVTWTWDYTHFDRLDAFITAYLGASWNIETAEVTIGTRYRDNDFSGEGANDYWNALLYLPLDAVNYRNYPTYLIRDLNIKFRVIEEAT
jgi:hypothetical protein